MNKHAIKIAIVMLAFLAATPIQVNANSFLCPERGTERARVEGEVRTSNSCLLVGGGVLFGKSEFLSDDLSTVFPIGYLNYGSLYLDTAEVGFYFLGAESGDNYWGLAVLLEYPFDGFAVKNEAHLNGLDDRNPAVEAGLSLASGGLWGSVEIGINFDIENKHQGYVAYASYGYPIHLPNLMISPTISWKYRDEKNSDYYYGVDVDEADQGGRVVYEVAESTNSIGLGYTMNYVLNRSLSLFHSLEVRFLDELLNDSPLTVNEKPVEVTLGALYRIF